MKRFLSYLFVAILGGVVFAITYSYLESKDKSGTPISQEQLSVVQANYTPRASVVGPDFVDAADITVHAVVHIKAELQQRNEVYKM